VRERENERERETAGRTEIVSNCEISGPDRGQNREEERSAIENRGCLEKKT